MTSEQEAKLEAARKRNPSAGRAELAKLTGIHESSVQRWLRRKGGAGAVKAAVPVPAKGRTLAEFRQTYDKATIIPQKVKAALRELGATGWEYEVQFARMAGVSLPDLSNFRDAFSAHVVPLREGRRVWAGSAKTATEMREML